MRCFYSQDLELDLPAGHPFPMEKFRVSKDMLLDGGILRPEEIIEVRTADVHLLQRVHERDYIGKIQSGLLDRKEQLLLGLPVTPKLYQRSITEVEATRLACHAASAAPRRSTSTRRRTRLRTIWSPSAPMGVMSLKS